VSRIGTGVGPADAGPAAPAPETDGAAPAQAAGPDPAQGPARTGLAVATWGLTKRFGHQVAVNGIDLAVPRGSVYGFLGPNGSGKTTTIRMLLGLIKPTEGRHEVLGARMPAGAGTVLHRVGALVEGPAFHPYLSGRDNLLRMDAADRTADPSSVARRVDAALDRVGLLAAARKRYRAYSLGMRQRLALAGSLLVHRDLLILDEPTNGLDPQGTREVRGLITSLAADGVTVMLSTHLLSEVEQICDHVGVMHVGRLVAQAPLAELRARTAPRARVLTDRPEDAARVLRAMGATEVLTSLDEASGVLQGVAPEKVVAELVHDGVGVRSFTVASPDLEEMFVSLTGEGFDVSG
jgi:ABC-2 type transport system ATP-binding protein